MLQNMVNEAINKNRPTDKVLTKIKASVGELTDLKIVHKWLQLVESWENGHASPRVRGSVERGKTGSRKRGSNSLQRSRDNSSN